jgi:GalNAc-alpha-(1->4)-GalNAc-alpha-(1->3)-diNAcBac-PP-undecaprenol alpha-1,4-N-acetyl-D-galactosaminyltransferase
MRLSLVISSLSYGGAERVMSMMANYLAEKGLDVILITLDTQEKDFYELDPKVKRVAIGLMQESPHVVKALFNNLRRIRALRKAIKTNSPDAVISFVDKMNVLTLLSCIGLSVNNKIVSERTDPTKHEIGRIWELLRRITYPLAKRVVLQTENVGKWARNIIREEKIAIIPNPFSFSNEVPEQDDSAFLPLFGGTPQRTIVTMGRLSYEKGFDLLLRAFAELADSFPEWRVIIFGEGDERDSLSCLARDLRVADKVFLPGRVKNPAFLLKQADLFVMPSRYEGFPNALCEAMVCGLPVISFDCPSGPRDIISDGIDGILVPPEDVNALAEAIAKLIGDVEKRRMLSQNAKQVAERFGISQVIRKWEDLIYHEQ